MLNMWRVLTPCLLAAIGDSALGALPLPPPGVQVTHQYGIEFSEIGAPGNAPTNAAMAVGQNRLVGAVLYSYRASRTEITVAQWAEFVQAFQPYYTGSPLEPSFWSLYIRPAPGGGVVFDPSNATHTVEVSWYMAARFCNWLQNGKATNREAFDTGAYDMTGLPVAPGDVEPTQLPQRNSGAAFWLVSQDEWVKAGYFDPLLNGGAGGYWNFAGRSDSLPVPGFPSDAFATTSAGIVSGPFWTIPVAGYPNAQSPWGLFDISGSATEWTDSRGLLSAPFALALGSRAGSGVYFEEDWLAFAASDFPQYQGSQLNGIRIATNVPAPAPAVAIVLVAWLTRRERCPVYRFGSRGSRVL